MSQRSRTVPPVGPAVAVSSVVTGFQRLAFWAAVCLPLAYLPLLSSPLGKGEQWILAALLAANIACLLVGHEYSP